MPAQAGIQGFQINSFWFPLPRKSFDRFYAKVDKGRRSALQSFRLESSLKDIHVNELTVQLSQNNSKSQKKFTLMIKDNGIGLPFKIDNIQSKTLGLSLVKTLVNQLEGEMQIEQHEGTTFIINFDEIKYEKRM